MNSPPKSTMKRYLALDLHKHYLVVGGVNRLQEIALNPRRISLEKFPAWARANLLPTDDVVIEATTNAWHIYDLVLPLVNHTLVAHPPLVKWIAEARVKTDRHDVLRLAHLLAAGLIPEVWVPPIPVRQLRSLLAHRRRLVSMGTCARNHLHSLLHRYAIQAPQGKIFSQKHRAWWHNLDLSLTERMRVRHDLATIDQLNQSCRRSTKNSTASAPPILGRIRCLSCFSCQASVSSSP